MNRTRHLRKIKQYNRTLKNVKKNVILIEPVIQKKIKMIKPPDNVSNSTANNEDVNFNKIYEQELKKLNLLEKEYALDYNSADESVASKDDLPEDENYLSDYDDEEIIMRGLAVSSMGEHFICDIGDSCIKYIDPDFGLIHLAGSIKGYHDSEDSVDVQFNKPCGIAVDSDDNLIIADTGNNCLRKIELTRIGGEINVLRVLTIAGSTETTPGYKDGEALESLFNKPSDIALDAEDNIYVSDAGNNCIRKIIAGNVLTLGEKIFNNPQGIAINPVDKTIIITDTDNNCIKHMDKENNITIIAGKESSNTTNNALPRDLKWGEIPTDIILQQPTSVVVDGEGVIFISDTNNNCIRVIKNNVVSTILSVNKFNSFQSPTALALDKDNLIIADTMNEIIRQINGIATKVEIKRNMTQSILNVVNKFV